MIIEEFLNGLGWALLAYAGIQIATTIKTYGGFPGKAIWRMACISLRGRKALLFIFGISELAIGISCAAFPEQKAAWAFVISPLFQCGVALVALNGACLPPTILFLGTSQGQVITFLARILILVWPLKIVHMIESIHSALSERELVNAFEYRVRANWEKAVEVLSEISAVTLLDTRIISPAVIHEICHATSSEMFSRTFFIVGHESPALQLRERLMFSGVRSRLLTSDETLNVLTGIGWDFLFTRGKSLGEYLEERTRRLRRVVVLCNSDFHGSNTSTMIEYILSNESAFVRQTIATFFLHSARLGRPVSKAALPLFEALVKERGMPKLIEEHGSLTFCNDERTNEAISQTTAAAVIANAIAATIGANALIINYKDDIDPAGLRETFLLIQKTHDDPVVREDAAKYQLAFSLVNRDLGKTKRKRKQRQNQWAVGSVNL